MLDKYRINKIASIFSEQNIEKIQRYKKEFYQYSNIISFTDFISQKMREKKITRYDLAKLLGFHNNEAKKKSEILKKIINTPGYTTNRDRIILICLALNCNYYETNHALNLYDMRSLDEHDLREQIIIIALYNHMKISTINTWLQQANLLPLTFSSTSTTKKTKWANYPLNKYEIIKEYTTEGGDFVGDYSLDNLYSPAKYFFISTLELRDNEENQYTLSAYHNGTYELKTHFSNGDTDHEFFENLETGFPEEFSTYFLKLEEMSRQKIQSTLSLLDDTRNYDIRFDARIKNSSLYIYAETFNYSAPEWSEYFQMMYENHTFTMTVTHKSLFLQHHLGEHYFDYYPNIQDSCSVIEKYTSIEDIQNKVGNSSSKKMLLKTRVEAFEKLSKKIQDSISKLKTRELLISYPGDYFSDIKDIANFYGIEDAFSWNFDELTGNYFTETESAEIILSDNEKLAITTNELQRGIELGISSFSDICSIIQEKGTLESLLD